MTNSKIYLYDAALLRVIAIILLVFYHAFSPYVGAWTPPSGYVDVPLYYWGTKMICSFRMDLLVFISGYIYALTLQRKSPTFGTFVRSKIKRLILPSVVFSAVYILIFWNLQDLSFGKVVYGLLSGVGHMWFLPMLFWAMLLSFGLDRLAIKDKYKLLLVFCMPVLSLLPLPFRLNTTLYHILFFYLGALCFRYKDKVLGANGAKRVVSLIFVWGGGFLIGTLIIRDYITPELAQCSMIKKGILLELSTFIRITYALLGIGMAYMLVNYLLHKEYIRPKAWVENMNQYCYGIYLFQQFILQYLYYKTSFPEKVGPYWLPWLGFLIALCLSFLFSYLLRKTKLGRILI